MRDNSLSLGRGPPIAHTKHQLRTPNNLLYFLESNAHRHRTPNGVQGLTYVSQTAGLYRAMVYGNLCSQTSLPRTPNVLLVLVGKSREKAKVCNHYYLSPVQCRKKREMPKLWFTWLKDHSFIPRCSYWFELDLTLDPLLCANSLNYYVRLMGLITLKRKKTRSLAAESGHHMVTLNRKRT